MFRSLYRRLRRVLRQLRPPVLRFVYDTRYEHSVSALPVDPFRGERVLTFLAMQELLSRADLRRPKAVSMEAIRAVHTDAYLEALQAPQALGSILGIEVSDFDQEEILLLQRRMVGGTLEATDLALEHGGIGVNLGGGFHHARTDRGGGFCVFNDVAIAIRYLRRIGFTGRILVVDCDLHDGDGTREIFAADDTVHTFSIHNQHLDDSPALASTSIALGADVEDAVYLDALRRALPPLFEEFRPAFLFYLAGSDPAAGDAIGNWRISVNGLLERDRFVAALARERPVPLPFVIVLSGGYGPNSWRPHARFFASLLGLRTADLPSNDDMLLARYRQMARILDPADLTGFGTDVSSGNWSLTAQELESSMDIHPKQDRLLGYYSTQGVELALERYGLLHQVRAFGFKEPTIVIALDDPSGHRVRLFGDAAKSELLLELVLRRDRRTLQGFELLFVEWLLLQNPRVGFSPDRPRLPGQEHPGLGLVHEVVAMLVMVCERLQLEGVLYVPAHFHTAVFSGASGLRWLRPRDEARFQAMCKATAGMGLAEASWALEDGRVLDPGTGEPFHWHGEPMVLPVSARLKEQLEAQARALADGHLEV